MIISKELELSRVELADSMPLIGEYINDEHKCNLKGSVYLSFLVENLHVLFPHLHSIPALNLTSQNRAP